MCYDGDKTLSEDILDAIASFPGYPADDGFAFATWLAGGGPRELASHIAGEVAGKVFL